MQIDNEWSTKHYIENLSSVVDRRVMCAEEYRKYPECSSCTLTPSPETYDNILIL
jgi:hypothetical protein